MDKQLRTAIELIPLIQSLTYGEASVAVTDRHAYLINVNGKQLTFQVQPGDPLKEGAGSKAAMDSGKLISREQPASVFGFPYLVHSNPIRNEDGTIIGSIVIRMPLHLEQELGKMAVGLATAMTQFSGTFQQIAAVAENTAEAATRLASAADQVQGALKETEAVTEAIGKVSDRTRLLGLNAMIEASHAGAAGAGFGVVAREIQGLSQQSLKATGETTKALGVVSTQNSAVITETRSLQANSESLNAQVEECLAIVEELTALAQKLKDLAARSDGLR